MLVKLSPEQASRNWHDIKVAIEESLPPTVGMQSDRMQNILTAILTDEMLVWVSTEDKDGSNAITGIVLTTFTFDAPSGTRSLLIYCVYGYGTAKMESWKSGIETLTKYAKHQNCHRIIGYTDIPSIIKFADMAGAETKYRLVSFPI